MKRRSPNRLKIVVAPNAFKESLTAWEAARAIERGLRRALEGRAEIVLVPVADGGDGTAETLVRATGGTMRRARVEDPLGRPVWASYGVTGESEPRCVVEMARASGLALLALRERNPMRTTTRGTGQLIRRAAGHGLRRFVVGVGGSATVDGGTGAAQVLGYRFLDRRGRELDGCGGNLEKIASIDPTGYRRWLAGRIGRTGPMRPIGPIRPICPMGPISPANDSPLEIVVASDVTNPLLGPRGAARIFGPQKGATPRQVEELERGLANLARVMRRDLGRRVERLAGGGAAGGLAAGLVAFCGAKIRPGAQVVFEAVGLEKHLAGADWVITGEGRIDRQTACGKAPAEVARLARKHGARVIGLAGSLGEGSDALLRRGDFDALFSICGGSTTREDATREDAMAHASTHLTRLVSSIRHSPGFLSGPIP